MLFALLLAPVCAHAHTTKLSSADITLAEHSAEVSLTLNGADLEAALDKVEAAGGKTLMPPEDLPMVSLAIFEDPEGNQVGLVKG